MRQAAGIKSHTQDWIHHPSSPSGNLRRWVACRHLRHFFKQMFVGESCTCKSSLGFRLPMHKVHALISSFSVHNQSFQEANPHPSQVSWTHASPPAHLMPGCTHTHAAPPRHRPALRLSTRTAAGTAALCARLRRCGDASCSRASPPSPLATASPPLPRRPVYRARFLATAAGSAGHGASGSLCGWALNPEP